VLKSLGAARVGGRHGVLERFHPGFSPMLPRRCARRLRRRDAASVLCPFPFSRKFSGTRRNHAAVRENPLNCCVAL
ncbi:MAG TPA: hypothetical protein VJS18_16545, partial [Paraburkholderia sp.]|nr:hypothetical protein [Paraburkholderia sp.]